MSSAVGRNYSFYTKQVLSPSYRRPIKTSKPNNRHLGGFLILVLASRLDKIKIVEIAETPLEEVAWKN